MNSSKSPFSAVEPVDHERNPTRKNNPWQPSYIRRAPWQGVIAMLGAFFGVLASVLVLYTSNNMPIRDWSVQPTVYLAITSAATNIFLHFALTEALTIAWWVRSLRDDTTIADLHRTWEYGHSLWAAVTSGRRFNSIALASILVALVPINGPLLQRASRVRQGHFEEEKMVNINIAQVIPEAYTGYLSNRGHMPTLLTPAFVDIVQDFNQKAPIPVGKSSCRGKCITTVAGAGLVANCSQTTHPFHLTRVGVETASEEEDDRLTEEVINGTDIFGTYFIWPGPLGLNSSAMDMVKWEVTKPGTFNLGVQIKEKEDCNGELVVRNCTFRPAAVVYPVSIDGNTSTITLAPNTRMSDDRLLDYVDAGTSKSTSASSSFNTSTYGGFFKSLSDSYDSAVRMDYGPIGFQIWNEGALSNRYVSVSKGGKELDCTTKFRDPTEDIIASVRELMFRTAMASANGDLAADNQTVPAHESFTVPVYSSSYLYLGLAVMVSLLGWIATLPVFLGWWRLGRTVSISPIETAKAFGAPHLKSHDSNADAKGLLRDVGAQELQYGAIAVTTGEHVGEEAQERFRLGMGKPSAVNTPIAGETFIH